MAGDGRRRPPGRPTGRGRPHRRHSPRRGRRSASKPELAAGFDPDDSLIEKMRSRSISKGLLGTWLRQGRNEIPPSKLGIRLPTARTSRPSAASSASSATTPPTRCTPATCPSWCTVTAIDAFDVVTILDFGGDRTRALRELAERFGLSKTEERKVVSRVIFRLMRQGATAEHDPPRGICRRRPAGTHPSRCSECRHLGQR